MRGSWATKASRPRFGIAVSWAWTFGGRTGGRERLSGCTWSDAQDAGQIVDDHRERKTVLSRGARMLVF